MSELLATALDSLAVPPAFARHDRISDAAVLADLYTWKSNTEPLLNRLDSLDLSTLSNAELADLVCTLTPLTAVAHWASQTTRSLAFALLARVPITESIIVHILTQVIKPLFTPTPHPRLHTSTARILPRPAEAQDTYIEQPWKDHPGLDEVIRWCLLSSQSSTYESKWPLFLPPVMSFLDDYQVPYKLQGARLVSDMLTRVHPELLLRTGVDTLMFNSLTNSLSHLGDQSTPEFIRLAVTTTLQLIDLTTPSAFPSDILLHDELHNIPARAPTHTLSPSLSKSLSTRFFRLSTLLTSLLGTVIMYTPTLLPPVSSSAPDPFVDPEHVDIDPPYVSGSPVEVPTLQKRAFNPTLVAAAGVLPSVLSALDIGCTRFLKAIIPVLAEWLALALPVSAVEIGTSLDEDTPLDADPLHHNSQSLVVDLELHLASLSSLSVLFRTCAPRIGAWSTTIVDALGRCWVGCLDIENQCKNIALTDSLSGLKKQLKITVIQLSAVCPGVIENEYATLLASNKAIFQNLL